MGLKENFNKMGLQDTEEYMNETAGRYKARGFRLEDRSKLRTWIRRREMIQIFQALAIVAWFLMGVAIGYLLAHHQLVEGAAEESSNSPEASLEGSSGAGVVVFNDAGEPVCRAPNARDEFLMAGGYNFRRC